MTKLTFRSLAAGAAGSLMLAASAVAGTTTAAAPKAPVPVPPPAETVGLFDSVGVTLEAGYDSEYYFRGLWFSSNNVWTGATLSIPLADKLTLTPGVLYTSSVDTDIPGSFEYSELDLFAGLSYDAGFAKFGLVYTYYSFFDTFSGSVDGTTFGFPNAPDSTISGAQDLGFTVAKSFFGLNTTVGYWYDFKIDGQYFEAAFDYPVKVNNWLTLVPAAAIGYGIDYYTYTQVTGVDDGWTHVRVGLSAPIQLTKSAILTPYIAGNFSLDARDQINTVKGRNDVFGGVKLSVSF